MNCLSCGNDGKKNQGEVMGNDGRVYKGETRRPLTAVKDHEIDSAPLLSQPETTIADRLNDGRMTAGMRTNQSFGKQKESRKKSGGGGILTIRRNIA
jgi:hypothetical protein